MHQLLDEYVPPRKRSFVVSNVNGLKAQCLLYGVQVLGQTRFHKYLHVQHGRFGEKRQCVNCGRFFGSRRAIHFHDKFLKCNGAPLPYSQSSGKLFYRGLNVDTRYVECIHDPAPESQWIYGFWYIRQLLSCGGLIDFFHSVQAICLYECIVVLDELISHFRLWLSQARCFCACGWPDQVRHRECSTNLNRPWPVNEKKNNQIN